MARVKDIIASFVPRPLNRLNGSPDTPRRPSSTINNSSSPPKPPSSPVRPPAHLTDGSEALHTTAHFVPPGPPSNRPLLSPVVPRKRSFDSATVVSDGSQSHRTTKSASNNVNHANVDELRHIPGFAKPVRVRKRYRTSKTPQQGIENDPIAVDDPWDEDVQLVPSQDQEDSLDSLSLQELGDRFQGKTSPHRKPKIDLTRQISDTSTVKRKREEGSPDHLAPTDDEVKPVAPRRIGPSSISGRGHITPATFVHRPELHGKKPKQPLRGSLKVRDYAKTLIGDGLKIRQAVSGDSIYDDSEQPDGQRLVLSMGEMSYILHPRRANGSDLEHYQWCKVNIQTVNWIERPANLDGSQIIYINRSSEPSTNASATLILDFQSSREVEKFLEWCNCLVTESNFSDIRLSSSEKLAGKLNHCRTNAEKYQRSKLEETKAIPKADDIALIQRNTAKRAATAKLSLEAKPKLKDSMVADTSLSATADPYAISPDSSPSSKRIRTTRATFALRESPPPQTFPSWTRQNPAWSERWRNSVVFPATGKNRAVVDKVDIERLDEGEFLNDNLIIFYLRYLQINLETQREDLAERVYFHNTFFYERLKPAKSGSGINYDNVKGWTSKVDLFSKDFIVVPINEYAHWYVAIICNAPRLVKVDDDAKDDGKDDEKNDVDDKENVKDDRTETTAVSVPDNETPTVEILPSTEDAEPIERVASDLPGEGDTDLATKLSQIRVRSTRTASSGREVEDDGAADAKSGSRRKKQGKRQSTGGRRFDPAMPRIITLDSLASPHSPACGYLKQYLIAELKDKKGIDIADPGPLGMTARDLPMQQNHCDCGLYLLGYIKQFLEDPDTFVRSIMQREEIEWKLDPSALRHDIRSLLFDLQKEQQKREDAAAAERRNRKRDAFKAKQQQDDGNEAAARTETKLEAPGSAGPASPDQAEDPPEATCEKPKSVVDASQLLHSTKGVFDDSFGATESTSDRPEILEVEDAGKQELATSAPNRVKDNTDEDPSKPFVPLLPESPKEPTPPFKKSRTVAAQDDHVGETSADVTRPAMDPASTAEVRLSQLNGSSTKLSREARREKDPVKTTGETSSYFAGRRTGDRRGVARLVSKPKNADKEAQLQQKVISIESDSD